jgi:hypothetical protein
MTKLSAQSGYYGIRWKSAQSIEWQEPAKFPFMTYDDAATQCSRMSIQNAQVKYEVVARGVEDQNPQPDHQKPRVKSCQEEKLED